MRTILWLPGTFGQTPRHEVGAGIAIVPARQQNGFVPPGLGWSPDPPDPRDWHIDDRQIKRPLSALRERPRKGQKRRRKVDLREFLPPVGHQQGVHCSCSFACVSLVEYFQRRWLGDPKRLSVRFVYDVTRIMMGLSGNVATNLRSTLKATSSLGVPPERCYRFSQDAADVSSPSPFVFGLAHDRRGCKYFRILDHPEPRADALATVCQWLAAGVPFVFAFCVPESVTMDEGIGCRMDQSYHGGQAVLAVGYDDTHRVLGCRQGALLIRNSWGPDWGDEGYGWLPYDFFAYGLVSDFWSLSHPSWTSSFQPQDA
jgi:C1A family cysteine protease